MKKLLAIAVLFGSINPFSLSAQYHVLKSLPVNGDGKWDYIAVCAENDNVYASHGTCVNVLDRNTGAAVATIDSTIGVHGITFHAGKGYISNGKLNTVTVFDLASNNKLAQIKTGENPDAIMYEPFTKMIITCNGRSKDISIIDPQTNTVMHTVALKGKPETAVSDGKGNLYINLEDKNEIVWVDLKSFTVKAHWSLEKGTGPTGLAIDTKTHRLFAGCDGQLYVVNADNGKVVTHLPIGDECDGVAFDPASKNVFTANGSGTLSIIQEVSADRYLLKQTLKTEMYARTIAMDEKTHKIYLPTAKMEAAKPAANGVKAIKPSPVAGTFHILVVGK